jgi:hypothetical protein
MARHSNLHTQQQGACCHEDTGGGDRGIPSLKCLSGEG